MKIVCDIFLYTFDTHGYTYFVVFTVAILLIAYLVVMLWLQNREKALLTRSLAHLASMKRHGVEYELVLQAMKLATWRIDLRDMTLTFENDYRSMPNLYTPVPGTPMNEVLKLLMPEDAEKMREVLKGVKVGKQDIYHLQFRIKEGNGDYYWSDIYGTVSERDDDGKPITFIGTAKNIDKQKKQEKELLDARLKAEESERLKTAFIQNISHEVRTPLNAIVGFSEILPNITDPNEREELMRIIKENNAKLLQIFEDMMNISKVEAHDEKANLVKSNFDLVQLVQEKMARCSSQNTNADLTMEFASQEQKVELFTDKERVDYIVTHFLENAVKFTSQGNITAGISLMAGVNVRVWVSDTGKGISSQDQEKIFDRFFKVDYFIQGAGLGLAVCRSYALSLGGNVGVESQLGQGSTFWLEIPLETVK